MKITIDPDLDTLENLELVAKIIESKIADREIVDSFDSKKFMEIIKNLEKVHGKRIPIKTIEEDADITESDLENLKRKCEIYEPTEGFIERI